MKVALTHIAPYRAFNHSHADEPANLLGMTGLLRQKGIEVKIFHGAKVSRATLKRQLREFKPDVVGLSAVATNQESYTPWRRFCEKLRGEGVITILGGMGPTTDPNSFARDIGPDIIVRGEGELFIPQLADLEFSLERVGQLPTLQGRIDRSLVLGFDPKNLPRVDLDSLDYQRDYDLRKYDFSGWPYLQIGCPHGCIFCPGDKKIRYKSPQAAIAEIGYLIDVKGARIIESLGSDFTAGAKQAAAIIEAIVEEQYAPLAGYKFIVRLDTLMKTLKRDGKTWDEFAAQAEYVTFNTGIETFLPVRRSRLGKDFTPRQAQALPSVVDFCLAWADTHPNVEIETNMIIMDPWSNLDEIESDFISIEQRLRKYPNTFHLVPGAFYNPLQPAIGTKSYELFPGQAQGYDKLTDIRTALFFLYLCKGEERDYEAYRAQEIELSDLNVQLAQKLRKLIKGLQMIKSADLKAFSDRVVKEVFGDNNLAAYDELMA